MRLIRVMGVTALLILAGCATVNGPSAQQQAQSTQAEQLASQGQFEQAAQAYMQLAAQNRGTSGYFRLRAAEAWRENGDMDHAAQALQGVSRSRLSTNDQRKFDLLQAEIALDHGDAARALALTSGPVGALTPALEQRTLELRAQAQAAGGHPFQAARTRQRMNAQLQGMDQAQNQREIVQLLGQLGTDGLKQRQQTLTPGDSMHVWIARALSQLGGTVALSPPPANQPVGTLMPGQAQGQGYKNPGRVALLLPVSGSLARAARLIREGFFAAYLNDSTNGNHRPQVTVYDSGGTPEQSVAAYQQAVSAGAQLVVGPLTRQDVQAVIGQALLPVPVLALNHPDNDTVPPPNVNEFGLLPETEGASAARRMLADGITHALVVVSSEGFAQRSSQAFQREFTAGGGQVLDTLTLDPQVINYSDQIKTVDPKTLGTGGGIFISTRPPQARLLLPQLRLAQFKQPVFATSYIYDGYDNPDQDRDLNGVTFCDAPWLFDAQPGLPSRAAIAQLLPATSGTGARLFAFGMDAWALTPYLDWLRTHPGSYVPGATGQLVEDDFGRIQRTLIWARFKDGIAHPLSGSLDLGTPTNQTTPTPASKSASTQAVTGGQ